MSPLNNDLVKIILNIPIYGASVVLFYFILRMCFKLFKFYITEIERLQNELKKTNLGKDK